MRREEPRATHVNRPATPLATAVSRGKTNVTPLVSRATDRAKDVMPGKIHGTVRETQLATRGTQPETHRVLPAKAGKTSATIRAAISANPEIQAVTPHDTIVTAKTRTKIVTPTASASQIATATTA